MLQFFKRKYLNFNVFYISNKMGLKEKIDNNKMIKNQENNICQILNFILFYLIKSIKLKKIER